MDKSKKIIIILLAILAIVLVFIAVLASKEGKKTGSQVTNLETPNQENVISPESLPVEELMTAEEKETLKLEVTPETKIQVISRDENGKINAYRILKNE